MTKKLEEKINSIMAQLTKEGVAAIILWKDVGNYGSANSTGIQTDFIGLLEFEKAKRTSHLLMSTFQHDPNCPNHPDNKPTITTQ